LLHVNSSGDFRLRRQRQRIGARTGTAAATITASAARYAQY
jgi:hypothetical protein